MVVETILDTDILIDLLRKERNADQWVQTVKKSQMGVPSIAWMEIVQGATDNIKRSQAMRFLRQFRIVHFEMQDSFWSMHQFAQFHLSHGVGLTDTIIAAVAVRLRVPLYTRNVKHYQMLPNLQVIRPYL